MDKKEIYKGNGYGNIWIANNRLFLNRMVDEYDSEVFSINLEGYDEIVHDGIIICDIVRSNKNFIVTDITEQRNICLFNTKTYDIDLVKNNAFFDYIEDDTIYYEEIEMDTFSNDKIIFKCIHVDSTNDTLIATIDCSDTYGLDTDFSINVNCVQVLDDYVYFSYGEFGGTAHIYQGGQIARVKKDGTNFEILDGEPVNFTVYKKDDEIIIKDDGKIQELFIDEDGNVWVYTEDSDNKIELITEGEDYYKKLLDIINLIKEIDYINDYVYFTVDQTIYDESISMGWRDGYRWLSSTYYRKNMKTGEIEQHYELTRTQ